MRNTSLVVLIFLTIALSACGQKGPLVLPDAAHPRKRIGAPKRPAAEAPVPTSPGTTAPVPASATPAPTPSPSPTVPQS